jgi:hypothetical protein
VGRGAPRARFVEALSVRGRKAIKRLPGGVRRSRNGTRPSAALRGALSVCYQSRLRSSAMSPITPTTVPRMMIAASM